MANDRVLEDFLDTLKRCLNSGLIGVQKGEDNKPIVYNGRPLYGFVPDVENGWADVLKADIPDEIGTIPNEQVAEALKARESIIAELKLSDVRNNKDLERVLLGGEEPNPDEATYKYQIWMGISRLSAHETIAPMGKAIKNPMTSNSIYATRKLLIRKYFIDYDQTKDTDGKDFTQRFLKFKKHLTMVCQAFNNLHSVCLADPSYHRYLNYYNIKQDRSVRRAIKAAKREPRVSLGLGRRIGDFFTTNGMMRIIKGYDNIPKEYRMKAVDSLISEFQKLENKAVETQTETKNQEPVKDEVLQNTGPNNATGIASLENPAIEPVIGVVPDEESRPEKDNITGPQVDKGAGSGENPNPNNNLNPEAVNNPNPEAVNNPNPEAVNNQNENSLDNKMLKLSNSAKKLSNSAKKLPKVRKNIKETLKNVAKVFGAAALSLVTTIGMMRTTSPAMVNNQVEPEMDTNVHNVLETDPVINFDESTMQGLNRALNEKGLQIGNQKIIEELEKTEQQEQHYLTEEPEEKKEEIENMDGDSTKEPPTGIYDLAADALWTDVYKTFNSGGNGNMPLNKILSIAKGTKEVDNKNIIEGQVRNTLTEVYIEHALNVLEEGGVEALKAETGNLGIDFDKFIGEDGKIIDKKGLAKEIAKTKCDKIIEQEMTAKGLCRAALCELSKAKYGNNVFYNKLVNKNIVFDLQDYQQKIRDKISGKIRVEELTAPNKNTVKLQTPNGEIEVTELNVEGVTVYVDKSKNPPQIIEAGTIQQGDNPLVKLDEVVSGVAEGREKVVGKDKESLVSFPPNKHAMNGADVMGR